MIVLTEEVPIKYLSYSYRNGILKSILGKRKVITIVSLPFV